jgi:tRNA A37 threonylcarbamoyladenosine modification protein TsaB
MKQYFGLGVGVLAGAVIGAAAVTGLHAQAKPPVFLITEIDITNPEAYGKEFAPKAQATIKAAGGKFYSSEGPEERQRSP